MRRTETAQMDAHKTKQTGKGRGMAPPASASCCACRGVPGDTAAAGRVGALGPGWHSVGAGEVAVGAGVHLYPLALVDEQRHLDHRACLQLGRLAAARLRGGGGGGRNRARQRRSRLAGEVVPASPVWCCQHQSTAGLQAAGRCPRHSPPCCRARRGRSPPPPAPRCWAAPRR